MILDIAENRSQSRLGETSKTLMLFPKFVYRQVILIEFYVTHSCSLFFRKKDSYLFEVLSWNEV